MTPLMLAEVGYRGYADATGGETFDGRRMPPWDDLPERTTGAWAAAAAAIVTAALAAPAGQRYATRSELAMLLATYLEGFDERFPDGTGYKWSDVAEALLDALGEMGAPVDALVTLAIREGRG